MTERIKAFVRGVGSAIDIGASGRGSNPVRSAHRSDAEALSADWRMVGKDMSRALQTFSAANAKASVTAK